MKYTLLLAMTLWIAACTNTRTVYRIDTVEGQAYYTQSKPSPEANGDYHIIDLDNNRLLIKKRDVKAVSPYTYVIRL